MNKLPNIIICGKSHTGKNIIGERVSKNLAIPFINVTSSCRGRDLSKFDLSQKLIRDRIKNLKGGNRVIVGLRSILPLGDFNGSCFIIYLSASKEHRVNFFFEKNKFNNILNYELSSMIDKRLGVKDFKEICDLHIVTRKGNIDNIVNSITSIFS